MDDFATSALHDDDITTIFFEVTSLLNTMHLPMYKWATNSTHLQNTWRRQGLPLQTVTQVLGMGWDTQSDTLHVDNIDITRHCRNDRRPNAKCYKSHQDFTTRLDCFNRWQSWGKYFSRIRGQGDSHGTIHYPRILP